MKDNCKKDFPNYCPNPAPPVPPYCPPVPCVPDGGSLYEAMNELNKRVNICMQTYNDVMHNCYETLHNLERAAEENGAYYHKGEVWTEEGYNAEEGSTYTIIHKACVDRHGEPIRMQLQLAYGNTSNSGIQQPAFSASQVVYADKIVSALPLTFGKWYGKVFYQGAPIATDEKQEYFTVGFTRNGVMKVYPNTVSNEQLQRDTIENSMGVSGVILLNGQYTDQNYRQNIPNQDDKTERIVMGQNLTTREVIFLVCGNENNINKNGMTTKTCAEILKQYGCDVAVEVNEGSNAVALDKGSLLFTPENNQVPASFAYWYISRRCYYKNDYQSELALLTQQYGQCKYETELQSKNVSIISEALKKEIADRESGDEKLHNDFTAAINNERDERKNADATLQSNINKEIADRKQEDTDLNNKITEEAATRLAQDNKEIAARKDADATLQNQINQWNVQLSAAENNITNLQTLYNTLQQQTAAMDATITSIQSTISSIETALNNLKVITTNLQTDMNAIKAGTMELPYLKLTGGNLTGAIDMGNHLINNLATPVANSDAVNKKYVDDAISGGITPPTGEYLPLSGGEMAGGIAMGGNRITTLSTPIADTDASTKKYVDDTVSNASGTIGEGKYLPLSGGTMTGELELTTAKTANNKVLISDTVKVGNTDIGDNSIRMGNDQTDMSLTNGFISVTEGSKKASVSTVQISITDGTDTVKITPNNITGLGTPILDSDATSKAYVDAVASGTGEGYVSKTGGTMTGDLLINNAKLVVNGAEGEHSEIHPTVIEVQKNGDIVSVGTVEAENNTTATGIAASGELSLVTMNGAISLHDSATGGNVVIKNVGTPENNTDSANKAYVDSKIVAGNYLATSGGTMSGVIDMGGNKITNGATPTADSDIATKAYVDSKAASGGISFFDRVALQNYNNAGTPFAPYMLTVTTYDIGSGYMININMNYFRCTV